MPPRSDRERERERERAKEGNSVVKMIIAPCSPSLPHPLQLLPPPLHPFAVKGNWKVTKEGESKGKETKRRKRKKRKRKVVTEEKKFVPKITWFCLLMFVFFLYTFSPFSRV